MNAKSKRPAVLDLGSLMVQASESPKAEAQAGTVEQKNTPAKGESTMLRTSMLYHRAVHDVLRSIAFEERCNISDLVNEGLDHVLSKRNFPTISELKKKST